MKSKKGGQFEREICKLLSLWWTGQGRDDIFWRTPGSGARATVRRKKGLQTADATADMMSSSKHGKPLTEAAVFEMKRGYSDQHKIVMNKKTKKQSVKKTAYGLEILSILDKQERSKEPVLIEWWRKLEEERIAVKRKFGFIIFRRDAKLACIVMNEKTYNFLCKRSGPFYDRIISIHFGKYQPLYILKLDDFLQWCKPQCFWNIGRQLKRRRQIKRRSK